MTTTATSTTVKDTGSKRSSSSKNSDKHTHGADDIATASTGPGTDNIRSCLLRHLGIASQRPSPLLLLEEEKQENDANRRPPPLQSFSVPLKDNANDNDKLNVPLSSKQHPHDATLKSMSTSSNSSPSTSLRVVAFHKEVSVLPIPMRTDYSHGMQRRLWCSREELQYNAQRNLREFQADGWNWRNVTEEPQMIVGATGELIHPVHCPRHDGLLWQQQQHYHHRRVTRRNDPFMNPFDISSTSSWRGGQQQRRRQQHYFVTPHQPTVHHSAAGGHLHSFH